MSRCATLTTARRPHIRKQPQSLADCSLASASRMIRPSLAVQMLALRPRRAGRSHLESSLLSHNTAPRAERRARRSSPNSRTHRAGRAASVRRSLECLLRFNSSH